MAYTWPSWGSAAVPWEDLADGVATCSVAPGDAALVVAGGESAELEGLDALMVREARAGWSVMPPLGL